MSELRAEELFFEADLLIKENKINEAKSVLLELLSDYPDYGRAHNHLGWLYNVKLRNYPKAKIHLELAIKYANDYHAVYANYSYLLIDMNLHDEMIAFGNKVVNEGVADPATIYNQMAHAYELKGNVIEAYNYYKKSTKVTISNKFLEELYASQTRVKGKMNLFQRIKLINK